MNFIKHFNQISKYDALIAGGKGASLGEMTQAGILVPPGFVVLSAGFEKFLEETDLNVEIDSILHSVNIKEMHTIENASEKIKDLILKAKMPKDISKEIKKEFKNLNSKFVAVRSSATAEDSSSAAWAGQLDSFLNTTEKTLLANIQKCWASLFTPRAIFYRFEKGLHNSKISVAVVVQKMVESEVSGIAFSVHPVTQDHNQMIIEAGYGLGEAIVSGQITPDSYVIEKNPRRIIDKNISVQERGIYRKLEDGGNEWQNIPQEKGTQQKLTDEQILELSELIIKIENHYGFPCDIEWAYENEKFYITQSRPITTLNEKKIENIAEFEKVYTRDTTLIIQQGWHDVVANAFERKKGIKNPHLPPVIHYMNDGVIEIWENNASTKWFTDTLQSEISNNPKFIVSILDQYEKEIKEIKDYWKKKVITSKKELEYYVSRVFEVMDGFVFMYYTAVDERTPSKIRNRALKMRDKDVYFYENDRLIRASLEKIYPDLKGYATEILRAEIDNPPTLETAKNRKKNYVMIGEIEGVIITLSEYQSKHNEYKFNIEHPPKDLYLIKGKVGNKGYAKGRVKIIKRKEQITEAQKGDIVVSPMTTPDFVPAMKKAAGIITDEGGITCHAAITSRELGIPCVIGTKIATKVLHDGDLVEVDADKGVVRILEKQSNKEKEIIFDKFISRPYSILQIEAYNRFLTEISEEIGRPATYPIFVYDSTQELVHLYYNMAELTPLIGKIGEKISSDNEFRKNIFSKLTEVFESIKKYFDGDLSVKTVKDLQSFWELFKDYFKYVAYTWVLPGLDFVPKKIKDEAMEIRKKTEFYAGRRDSIMPEFVASMIDNRLVYSSFLSLDEIKKTNGNFEKITQERSKGFLFYRGEIVSGDKISDFLRRKNFILKEPEVADSSEIKGVIAQKGFVKGVARIIYTEKDLKKISSSSDILISPMTRPEFVPAMKIAGAVVTDEGGVVCHAAIISREMKKPCIIGTKIATKVLHDGDLVEVDADKGVVRILEK